MLNYLWAFMLLIGVIWGALHGNLSAVTDGALTSAKESVMLCITMLGIMSFWTGLMEIGSKSGLIERLSAKMGPVLHFLFPKIPEKTSIPGVYIYQYHCKYSGSGLGSDTCWSEGNGILKGFRGNQKKRVFSG